MKSWRTYAEQLRHGACEDGGNVAVVEERVEAPQERVAQEPIFMFKH